MGVNPTAKVRRPRGRLLAAAAVLVAGAACAVLALRPGPEPTPEPVASARDPDFDDSGYSTAQRFVPPVRDPFSLGHVRDCFQDVGRRGIELLRRRLAGDQATPEQRVEMLVTIAQLDLYEGDFVAACAQLDEVRALVEADRPRFQKGLPTLIFLQGIAALRRGEAENCVECACEGSCIFPLGPQAVHRKREGSRQAVRYFTEYLQNWPDDVGVRWLLNLAYMTLGEYPERVPEPYRIPLDPFRSEVDVGRFVDIAPRLGLNRLNMAGGAVLDDFDNDGLLDLVVTTMDEAGPMAFYRNKGDGTFEDRTREAGLEKQLGGLYCVQTDYNNDGRLDLYVPRGAWKKTAMRHSLLRNNGNGTFTDVTREAGLLTVVPSQVACWADYDNDGWLDLFVGGEPGRFGSTELLPRSGLYRNKGDGTFEEVARAAGVANEGLWCKGACWGDFDGDGYPDLFVANQDGPCRLFRNNRNGTFTDVAARLGVNRPRQAFSCWFFDYDNDGWPDLFVASYSLSASLDEVIKSHLGLPFQGETCRLYRNLQGRRFEDVTEAVGLNLVLNPMGSNFVDVDNDGFLDFYLGTGSPKYSMLVPNRLFKNVGGKRFVDVTTSSGTGHLQKGHAVACGDWDRDGNVDIFEQLGGATPGDRFRNVLFQNPGHDNHWLTIKLVGKKTNRPAIGARIQATVPGEPPQSFYRHVCSGSSFGANPLQQTVGLGKARKVARLEIYWPTSNTRQVFRDVPVDQAIEITEFAPEYRPLNWTRVPVP
jgi:hypothetical protein